MADSRRGRHFRNPVSRRNWVSRRRRGRRTRRGASNCRGHMPEAISIRSRMRESCRGGPSSCRAGGRRHPSGHLGCSGHSRPSRPPGTNPHAIHVEMVHRCQGGVVPSDRSAGIACPSQVSMRIKSPAAMSQMNTTGAKSGPQHRRAQLLKSRPSEIRIAEPTIVVRAESLVPEKAVRTKRVHRAKRPVTATTKVKRPIAEKGGEQQPPAWPAIIPIATVVDAPIGGRVITWRRPNIIRGVIITPVTRLPSVAAGKVDPIAGNVDGIVRRRRDRRSHIKGGRRSGEISRGSLLVGSRPVAWNPLPAAIGSRPIA